MSTSFINFSHVGAKFCFVPAILMSSTQTDKNNFCFLWTKKHSQFGTFSQPSSINAFWNCLPHKSPASGCPYKFRSRRTTGSSMYSHDFGHLCFGRRIHTSGHSDLGLLSSFWASSIFTWVYADIASAACPSQSGSRAITSITFAAVICDADEPCSVNTA